MKFPETALPLYKIDWNLCKWSDRENNSFGLSLQDMRSWVAFAWWVLWVLVAILMSFINLIYEFGESYSSYMSVYCAYESYEFYVSLMSLMSLGCVCVCVSVYIGISICLSKFCVYRNVRLIVFACAVSGASFAPSSSCWTARICLDSTPYISLVMSYTISHGH